MTAYLSRPNRSYLQALAARYAHFDVDVSLSVNANETMISATVYYSFQRGYPETHEEPGEPDSAEIKAVIVKYGKGWFDLEPLMDEAALDRLIGDCVERHAEMQINARAARAEVRRDELVA